ncbi:uncharacterized protein LACBIDRAFT_331720 [Laccaria bicolor S238N-H82]|uniref:Predicted protein n=1 Tax=Laccaria bicolor (strain S238N-H82 / ATCC MYA-4686) TaxID=486041 RepID=B0DQC5_LACBS|nr:uncharacterized protein LACBIDRAFT_331720 [Laccaria bicolor S238N-H82]EDR03271.1 predicted protein [Laccaria bicolor S238N-H82]|eukprot:XP_001886067.1 predicted protein [Laccaria bicolor S238N-H82]
MRPDFQTLAAFVVKSCTEAKGLFVHDLFMTHTSFSPVPTAWHLLRSAVPPALVTACRGQAPWTPWYTCLIPCVLVMHSCVFSVCVLGSPVLGSMFLVFLAHIFNHSTFLVHVLSSVFLVHSTHFTWPHLAQEKAHHTFPACQMKALQILCPTYVHSQFWYISSIQIIKMLQAQLAGGTPPGPPGTHV